MSDKVLLKKIEAPRSHVSIRREPSTGWPRVSARDYQNFSDEVCDMSGASDFVGLNMCEPQVRGTISVFKDSELSAIKDLFDRVYPILLKRLLAECVIRPLRIEINSKMGGPIYARDDRKMEILRDVYFPKFLDNDYSSVENCYTMINVRLQQEKRSKVREVPVITPDGKYENVKLEGALRSTPLGGDYFSARARNVYNPNLLNNYKQVVDNTLHDVILTYEPFHHDMYKYHDTAFRFPGYVRAIDVKHFERCVGALVAIRAKHIGGQYETVQNIILDQPYLSLATDWKTTFLVKAAPGYTTQLASGDSSVATLGKETLICLYAAYFEQLLRVDLDKAVDIALNGGVEGRIKFFNYGDDNILYGSSEKEVNALQTFLSQFLTIEEEVPPAFLGWEYSNQDGFFLRDKSAIVNFWKPERPPGPPFRPFFFLGFHLRWQTYSRYGSKNITTIQEEMWDVMEEYGITRDYMNYMAAYEGRLAGGGAAPLNYITGKNYLLTDEEKERLGLSKSIGGDLSRKIFLSLVDRRYSLTI